MSRLVLLLLLTSALPARAFHRAVVKAQVKIQSDTIAERLEIIKAKRQAAVNAAQNTIAERVAKQLNDVFPFVHWVPAHIPGKDDATLTLTIREDDKVKSRYFIDYARAVSGVKKTSGPVDWGDNDPLFKPEEDKPLGSPSGLGDLVAKKVADQLKKKRPHVMTAFLSKIALCDHKPVAAKDRTFTIDIPLETIKASEESKVEILFWAKRTLTSGVVKGTLRLTPLHACETCGGPTMGMFHWFLYPEIGELKEWSPAIVPLFEDKQLFDHAFVYLMEYRSTEDSSESGRSTDYKE